MPAKPTFPVEYLYVNVSFSTSSPEQILNASVRSPTASR